MSAKPTLILEGGCVVTGDAKDTRYESADIVVAGNAILAIGPNAGAAHREPGIDRIESIASGRPAIPIDPGGLWAGHDDGAASVAASDGDSGQPSEEDASQAGRLDRHGRSLLSGK